ncbi:sodium-coupled monocarboxylate transporter 2-like [Ruditapes philippinarum]|uniref:sodium-coupled monocarboxylate transporter 2-like n=1 Tax=Ruditapes philippinarum TaxID=129788 RepID=UPI00295B07BB|nr:sodium-coupled monocarboxylate transporter 2-like [Ruditapes philippinarum]
MSIIVVGVLGTIYTSIGGIRTVIWTDVFQFIILFGGLIVIIVMGTINVGGLAKIYEVTRDGSRLNFSTTSVDPRVRHTVWGFLTAGFVNWLPNCCNQSAVQRISSMRTVRDTKISTFLNVPAVFLYGIILIFFGLLLYTHYSIQECDPWSAEYVSNANQLIPYYVMNVFRNIPGMTGLFIAALFSGALRYKRVH